MLFFYCKDNGENVLGAHKFPNEIHSIEERAGLPLSDFPITIFVLSLLRWLLLPFSIYALWKRSIPLIVCVFVLSIFLLWAREKEAIILISTLTHQDAYAPFLAGEVVKVHTQEGDMILISSRRQIGYVQQRALIDI